MEDRERKRLRLDNLTDAMYENIDESKQQIIDVNLDIEASVAQIAMLQGEIDTLVAVNNRTAVQNVELRSLRKDIALYRALLASQRLNKKLIRNGVVTSRFTLFLVGSRVRQTDIDGSE